jgi:signal transduction histidine kinase
MVKKLRRKFVLTAMLSLFLILVAIIGVINFLNYREVQSGADDALNILAENEGFFPEMKMEFGKKDKDNGAPPMKPEDMDGLFFGGKAAYNRTIEMPYQTRYFWVKLDGDGSVIMTDVGHIAAVSKSEAEEIATEVFNSGSRDRGYYDWHYRYIIKENSDGSVLLIFLDCSNGFYGANRLLLMTLGIACVSLVGMFILVYLFSGKAVAPVVESLEKQKRFITDAGHELKTPLAVMSANVDVIEIESGKTEWTQSIRGQIKRMNGLVKNMLTLSRMEEENIHVVFSDVDMSYAVKDAAQSFMPVAESRNLKYNMDIAENIHISGDKNAINQLSSLLIDNAMKYASEKGVVNICLELDSKGKKAIFEVSNTCDSIPEGNLDRLFDRFYRADSSRSRNTGGYGIGLSVARAIANSHGGSIEAKRDGDHMIRFIVVIPVAKQQAN